MLLVRVPASLHIIMKYNRKYELVVESKNFHRLLVKMYNKFRETGFCGSVKRWRMALEKLFWREIDVRADLSSLNTFTTQRDLNASACFDSADSASSTLLTISPAQGIVRNWEKRGEIWTKLLLLRLVTNLEAMENRDVRFYLKVLVAQMVPFEHVSS